MQRSEGGGSLQLVTRAAAFAAEAHAFQKRKGCDDPYINHPLRVAAAASAAGLSPEAIAAALLHDVVEDTARTLEDLAAAFPDRVVQLVHLLTQWWPDDAPNAIKAEARPRYYGAIAQDPEASAIKLLDRADNLDDMARMLPNKRDWAARYLRKSRQEVLPLLESTPNETARRSLNEALARLDTTLAALEQ